MFPKAWNRVDLQESSNNSDAYAGLCKVNPHPCGFLGDSKRDCIYSYLQIQRYRSKISGPLLDRIDIHMEVPSVAFKDLSSTEIGHSSAEILERANRVREIQTISECPARKSGELHLFRRQILKLHYMTDLNKLRIFMNKNCVFHFGSSNNPTIGDRKGVCSFYFFHERI